MFSLLLNCNKDKSFIIYHILCTPDFSLSSVEIFKSLIKKFSNNTEMIFYNMGNLFMHRKTTLHSLATFYRIVAPILFDSISKLEYRGYDSIGIACADDGKINLKKDAGKIAEVDAKLDLCDMEGKYGIAHVRWATHGDPSKIN